MICCFEAIEHLRHPETFLARASRLLAAVREGLADFPIVPAALATVYGTPRFNVGICRHPVFGDSP